jgi:hypothetical protein
MTRTRVLNASVTEAVEAVEAGEAVEGPVKKVARAEAGPFYLEDEDYGARVAPLSTAVRRAGGREATVAEEP